MSVVEDRLSDVDARGSEETDNLANERDLDRFILTGNTSNNMYLCVSLVSIKVWRRCQRCLSVLIYMVCYFCYSTGVEKPTSIDQPILIDIVLRFVQNFVPEFNAGDIAWVRSLKSSKFGILNCQCRTVVLASRIRSTFASLVKSTPIPAFIGKVLTLFFMILSPQLFRCIQSYEFMDAPVLVSFSFFNFNFSQLCLLSFFLNSF